MYDFFLIFEKSYEQLTRNVETDFFDWFHSDICNRLERLLSFKLFLVIMYTYSYSSVFMVRKANRLKRLLPDKVRLGSVGSTRLDERGLVSKTTSGFGSNRDSHGPDRKSVRRRLGRPVLSIGRTGGDGEPRSFHHPSSPFLLSGRTLCAVRPWLTRARRRLRSRLDGCANQIPVNCVTRFRRDHRIKSDESPWRFSPGPDLVAVSTERRQSGLGELTQT